MWKHSKWSDKAKNSVTGIFIITLFGCLVVEQYSPNPTSSTIAEDTSASVTSKTTTALEKDQVFLAAVELFASQEASEWARKISDPLKIRVAKEACTAFDEGTTYEEMKLLIIQRISLILLLLDTLAV